MTRHIFGWDRQVLEEAGTYLPQVQAALENSQYTFYADIKANFVRITEKKKIHCVEIGRGNLILTN